MKKIRLFTILLFSFILFTGCSNAVKVPANYERTEEHWQKQISLDSGVWLKNVDPWFLNGEPSAIEKRSRPSTIAVSPFTEVHVNGHFKVQIVGGEPSDCVTIFGSKADRQQISVEVINNRLYIQQIGDAKVPISDIVVRFGIRQLSHLSNTGTATIMARTIGPDPLTIKNIGAGSIYLQGKINVRDITHFGGGTIAILDAITPTLNINVQGSGNVKLRGRIGIKNITHNGNGSINIIGADSNSLSIFAAGSGLTTVSGYVKLKKVVACNQSRIYVNCVHSDSISIFEWDNAHVGIAGSTNQLNISLQGSSCFQGEYLYSENAYVKTRYTSHAEIFVDKKLFAAADDTSSIYYFGPAKMPSTFAESHSRILALGVTYRTHPVLACQARPNKSEFK